ncbi:MAG TPA: DUF5916 domain-containing protein [Mucilaginibacter sp.]|nr:DUF5916 domain-containing protein [Mucilaginibacter sp.]
MKHDYRLKTAVLLLFLFCFAALHAAAQKANANYRYHIKRAHCDMSIDGVMNEPAWLAADSADNFHMVLPMDTSLSKVKTVVRMTYDDRNLYILVINYNLLAGPYMVESMKRDWNFVKNDNFIFFIDPFNDRTDGFTFGANAAGGQWDGSMYAGGSVDLNWDNKWYSAVKQYPDKWIFEAAIPFKSIRYKKGIREWGINFSRNDLKAAEKSAWAPVPRQFPTASLAYTGTLVWDEDPPTSSSNVSIIPYALTGVTKDYHGGGPATVNREIGGDAKVSVTPALNLDLTVNPDFSQVDVDQQVIDLSRYQLFFPEKRQFFLENGDLFYNFGYSDIRPFFSRQIGLMQPIDAGARLTGKLDKDWRIGLMDIQTGNSIQNNMDAGNYGVVTLQRRVLDRSNIGFIFVNHDITGTLPGANYFDNYNRNVGMEFNLASTSNMWTGKLLGLKSFSPGVSGHDFVLADHVQYFSKFWQLYMQEEYVGKNYVAAVGFVPRTGYIKFSPLVLHNWFPKKTKILSHGLQFTSNYYFDENMNRTDNESALSYILTFRDRSTITLSGINDYVKLQEPFDPTNTHRDSLAIGTEHHYNSLDLLINSKPQSVFTYSVEATLGGYYDNGHRLSFNGTVGYRVQPYVNLAINGNYTDLRLPKPYGDTRFTLIGPKVDITFTNTLYFTTYVQYNEQQKDLNVNARFQWRYRPASDIFIVYAENSVPSPYTPVTRQLTFKWTYWWNI